MAVHGGVEPACLNGHDVVCVNEVKLALLGATCQTPGLSTLITNLCMSMRVRVLGRIASVVLEHLVCGWTFSHALSH